jgi:thioredoxin 1
MLKNVLLTMLLLLAFGCSNDQNTTQAPHSTKTEATTASASVSAHATAETTGPFLVFFLDPNGGPCRMQNSILNNMSTELEGKVSLRYVQTTVPEDLNVFYAYGIRALPTVLLADVSGKEIKRLTPGVKSADDIRGLLKSLPAG